MSALDKSIDGNMSRRGGMIHIAKFVRGLVRAIFLVD